MKRRTLPLVLALVLTIVSTGCFGMLGNRDPEETAVITIMNNLDPSDARTIQIRKAGDDEDTLGTVPAGAERALSFTSRELQGAYQLVARQTSGAAVVSREFTLFSGARVRWDMRTNSIGVGQ
jgi:hypothetical protein